MLNSQPQISLDGQILDVAWATAGQGIIDLANVGRIADKFAIQPFVCNSVGEEQLEASVELEIGHLGFASTFFETFEPTVIVDGLALCLPTSDLPELDTSEIEPPETIAFDQHLSGGTCSQYASEYSETVEMTAQPVPGAPGLWNVGMVNSESGQEVHSVPWDASSGEPLVLVFVGEYSDEYEEPVRRVVSRGIKRGGLRKAPPKKRSRLPPVQRKSN